MLGVLHTLRPRYRLQGPTYPCSLPCQVIDLQPTCNRRAARTVSTVRVADRREGGHLVPATTRSAAGRLGTATRRAASAAAGLGASTRGTDTAPTGIAGTGMGPAAPYGPAASMGPATTPGRATEAPETVVSASLACRWPNRSG